MQIRRTTAGDRAALEAVLAQAAAAGGFGLSEEARIDLEGGASAGFLAEIGGRPAGYAHLRRVGPGRELEIVLTPGFPEAGVGPLLERSLEGAGGRVVVWSADPEVDAAAAALGLEQVRAILRLERPLPLDRVPSVPDPLVIGVIDPGADVEAFLRLNNAAFAGHPENGGWTRSTVAERMRRPWYDPDGFFLGWEQDRVVAACWTKFHGQGVGEIYLIAVAPGAQGRGIGAALLGHGLGYLHGARGAIRAIVYTEAGNRRGLGLYANLGFEVEKPRRCWGSGSPG